MPLIQELANATVVPTYRDGEVLRGGLMVAQGGTLRPVPESLLRRGGKPHIDAPRPEAVPGRRPRIEGPVLFAGHLFDAYGHFLLESLQRLWACRDRPDLPVVWSNAVPSRPWQRDLLDLLGICNPVIDLGGLATDLGRVVLPAEGMQIRSFLLPEHRRFLGRVEVEGGGAGAGAKVWMSRSRLPPDRGQVMEDGAIEAGLAERGWLIFHPQEHPLRRQVEVFGSARRVAGWSASALHTVLLLRSWGGRLDVLARGEALNRNFTIIAEAMGLDQREHELPLRLLGGKGSKRRWSARPEDVFAALDG